MSRIALISDLHFGSVPDGLADALRQELEAQAIDLVIVAGDLTMKARSQEFQQAKNWLSLLTVPKLIVPGNHDIPYYNLFERFTTPFKRFYNTVDMSKMPVVEMDGLYVVGMNTVSSWQPHLKWQEGRIKRTDVHKAVKLLKNAPQEALKIVAAHHPFVSVPTVQRAYPVRHATKALDHFTETGVDLLLSGHTHISFFSKIRHLNREFVAIGAPTALSNRLRGEANGYWLICKKNKYVHLSLYLRNNVSFEKKSEHKFSYNMK